MIVVKVALSNLSRAAFLLAMALFVLCVVGTLTALGVFFWFDTDFWDYFKVGPVLQMAAALLGGFVVSSGLLFWHYRRQAAYMIFEATFFLSCLFLSLLNLLWIAPVLFFV